MSEKEKKPIPWCAGYEDKPIEHEVDRLALDVLKKLNEAPDEPGENDKGNRDQGMDGSCLFGREGDLVKRVDPEEDQGKD
jgi:hypothetical protein